MVAVLATQWTWLYMQRLLVSCTQYARLQGYLSSRSRSISACDVKPYYPARCFMPWAYVTSGTKVAVGLKTVMLADHPQATCRDGSQAASNSSQSTPVRADVARADVAHADVARADVARADVATDRSDQSGASCSGDHTLDRPHSGSRRKRDAPGSSVSPEKERGTGGFPHITAGNPQTLLCLCCSCLVELTYCVHVAVVWQQLLRLHWWKHHGCVRS